MKENSPVHRRSFLKTAALGATALLTSPFLSKRSATAIAETPSTGMRYRTLGRTGLRVSEIGFGGYPTTDSDIVLYALDKGINYIDTAQCYRDGESERVIGKALKGRRDKFVVTTKWCPYHSGQPDKKEVFLAQLDASLRRLQTDHVDLLLNHQVGRNSDGIGVQRLKNPEMFEAWEIAHKAGKARFLGFSGHDGDLMEVMKYGVDCDKFDAILCRYNFMNYQEQPGIITHAKKQNIGVIAMKTLGGAKGADLASFRDKQTNFRQAALKWVLSNSSISNLIISINQKEQVDEYTAASGQSMTEADHALLREYCALFSNEVCRFCNQCEPACPSDVKIADVLRASMYFHDYREPSHGVAEYAAIPSNRRAQYCTACPAPCETACPYDLPIKSLLFKAHSALNV